MANKENYFNLPNAFVIGSLTLLSLTAGAVLKIPGAINILIAGTAASAYFVAYSRRHQIAKACLSPALQEMIKFGAEPKRVSPAILLEGSRITQNKRSSLQEQVKKELCTQTEQLNPDALKSLLLAHSSQNKNNLIEELFINSLLAIPYATLSEQSHKSFLVKFNLILDNTPMQISLKFNLAEFNTLKLKIKSLKEKLDRREQQTRLISDDNYDPKFFTAPQAISNALAVLQKVERLAIWPVESKSELTTKVR